MKATQFRLLGASLATSTAMIVSAPASAQTAATPAQPVVAEPATPAQPDATEEVIVTAQRRSERLERTPVSVSILTGARLAAQNIVSERDLQTATPGLTVRSTGNSNQQNFAIRGQSLDGFSGSRPGVLPYIDEIQIGGAGGATSFYDLQSVQVLKGPQGTLFGRNSTGGAVLFTTAKPTYDFNGYALGRVGNYNLFDLEGAVTLPLVDQKLSLRLAGFRSKRDGFQYNLFRARREGGVNRYGGRASLLADVTPDLQNTLVVDYSRSRGGSTSSVLYSLVPTAPTPIASTVLYTPTLDLAFMFPGAFAAYLAAHPGADPDGINAFLGKQKARGPFVTNQNGPNYFRGRNVIVSNITTYAIGSDTTIKNVFGYTNLNFEVGTDQDGTPYGIFDSVGHDLGGYTFDQRQVSEELQIGGKAFDGNLTYVAGGYFAHERRINHTRSLVLDLAPLSPPIAQISASHQYNTTYAAYAQGTYDIGGLTGMQGLGVTAGLRYTSEKNKLRLDADDSAFGLQAMFPTVFQNNQQKTVHNVGWTLGLQDQVTSNLLLYVVNRRSYRAGSFNNSQPPQVGSGTTGGNSFKTQTVTDVEGGIKFAGRVADLPARLNIAVYDSWIRNEQRVAYVIANGFPSGITVNVPRSKVYGAEFDGQINPAPWLTLGSALTYTKARFTRNTVVVLAPPAVQFTTYPDTPRWSGSAYADVSIPVNDRFKVDLHGDVYAQKHIFFTPLGSTNPSARLPGYAVANFRIGLEDTKAGWSLSGIVKNAFDRTYYVGGFAFAPVLQTNSAVPGDPQTYLLEAKINF